MANLGRIIGMAAFATLIAPAGAQTPVDEIAKVHQDTKAKLDPVLPKRADDGTVLTAVRTDGITLTYEYKVEQDKANLPPEFDGALGKKAIAIACGSEQGRKVLQAGGRYGFEYKDKFDQTLLSVTVSKDACI